MVILYVILAVFAWIIYVGAMNLGLLFYYDWFSHRYGRHPNTTVVDIVGRGVYCIEKWGGAWRKLAYMIDVILAILNPITITATWFEAIIEMFIEEAIRTKQQREEERP